jgi:hypothetical protein
MIGEIPLAYEANTKKNVYYSLIRGSQKYENGMD